MEKSNEDKVYSNKNQEESLEISSTGYGLESVSTNSGDGSVKQPKQNNPSCGGL